MNPFHWQSESNFGDALNTWLWDRLLPGFRDVHPDTWLVGVGTVLGGDMLPRTGRKLVLGSGCGYGRPSQLTPPGDWDVRAVRGPLTAHALGLPPATGILDPAVLIADFPEFQNLPKTHRIAFVPHWQSAIAGAWRAICAALGIAYIDPGADSKAVVREIAMSRLLLAESLHGAILADAFRVPWIAVATSRAINRFKWNDWTQSLDLSYQPRFVPLSTRAEAILKKARFWGLSFGAPAEPLPPAAAPNGPARPPPVPPPAPGTARPTGLRRVAKNALAAPAAAALWLASRATPRLSADAVLARRKEQFRAVVDSVRRDYF